MENAWQGQAPGEGHAGEQIVQVTPLGQLVALLALAMICWGGWFGYQSYDSARHAPAVVGGRGVSSPTSTAPAAMPAVKIAAVEKVTQELAAERHTHDVQVAAWRAVSETSKEQIARLAADLQALETKIDAMPVPKATSSAHSTREDAAEGAKALHRAVNTAKATASLDVASLPLETVSAQALNVTGFGKDFVGIGNEKLSVGQALQAGETIVAIDPVSKSIVTNRRIINVSN